MLRRIHLLILWLALCVAMPGIAQDASVPLAEVADAEDVWEDRIATPPAAKPAAPTAEDQNAGDAATTGKDSEVMHAVAGLREKYKNVENPHRDMRKVVHIGEKLTYVVRWNGIPAATTTLRAKRMARLKGRDAILFEMHTESNDFLSVFYEVDSTIKSFADAITGQSWLMRRNVREGRYSANDRLEFDYQNIGMDGSSQPVSRYSKYDKKKGLREKEPRPIPGYLQDPLSMVFYLRNFKFKDVGDSYEFVMGGRKDTSVVEFEALRFQKVRVRGLGTFECVVVEPTGDDVENSDNLFVSKGKATIYLEKNTNIPVKLDINIPIGKASATLIKAETSPITNFKK